MLDEPLGDRLMELQRPSFLARHRRVEGYRGLEMNGFGHPP
jgi:hypothetical protein